MATRVGPARIERRVLSLTRRWGWLSAVHVSSAEEEAAEEETGASAATAAAAADCSPFGAFGTAVAPILSVVCAEAELLSSALIETSSIGPRVMLYSYKPW